MISGSLRRAGRRAPRVCPWPPPAATVVRSQPSFWEVHCPKVTLTLYGLGRASAELLEASQLLLTAGAIGPLDKKKNTPGPGNSVVNYVHPIPSKGWVFY